VTFQDRLVSIFSHQSLFNSNVDQEKFIGQVAGHLVAKTPLVMITGSSNHFHMSVVLLALNLVDSDCRDTQVLVIGGGREAAEMISDEFSLLGADCNLTTQCVCRGESTHLFCTVFRRF
jgi:enhancing lycopene biosynthesis protein 2